MRVRNDILRMYIDIHSWVGIVSGLALFIAFYAGAITMFEGPLQRWASPPVDMPAPTPLAETPRLVEAVLAEHPESASGYSIRIHPGPEHPARLSWETRPPGADDHDAPVTHYAALAPDGALVVSTGGSSPVAQWVDTLHQQVGLPFRHEVAMPIMGVIALLYAIALVSGVIALLPSLVKDLFALRLGRNLKRMWLDVHNVLGVFSLPFHLVMALTAVVFAFHHQFYDTQRALLAPASDAGFAAPQHEAPASLPDIERLAPQRIIDRLAEQAPGFAPTVLHYHDEPDHGLELRVGGRDPRYGLRSPTEGFAGVDPYTGDIASTDYLPGRQGPWFATITSFFALHFGNYGGPSVRWSYFLLGLGGAFLFYTGNLLWIESRRKKPRHATSISQTRGAHILGALTVGVSLGSIAGISLTVAAAKILPLLVAERAIWHRLIYYAVFLAAIGWAFRRGAARSAPELLYAAAMTTAAIPAISVLSALVPDLGWNHAGATVIVDLTAAAGATLLIVFARRAKRRAETGAPHSIWHAARPAREADAVPEHAGVATAKES